MKSNVSDYTELARRIYLDACLHCVAKVSKRDLRTIRSRVQKQGLSFLTITLPDFCSDFERSLEQGVVDPSLFRYFRKSGAIPAFLQDMLGRIFDKETGRIYDNEKITPTEASSIVESVRQICLAFKKTKLPCDPKRVRKAMEGFVATERDLSLFQLPTEDRIIFDDVSFMLWSRYISRIRVDMLVPKHGPGNTAERYSPNGKWRWRVWHDRLEPYFPFIGCALPLLSSEETLLEEGMLKEVRFVLEDDEQPSRVVDVPKTMKGPRIIAIEPCCNQYTQQAVKDVLYDVLERNSLTGGHINFADQSVNQRLAMSSSIDGRFATIDLKDASDRVPRELALQLFDSNPDLRDAIDSCRSKRAALPDGRIVYLNKFASMGNALCFPVEAMYFYTICVVALLRFHNLPVSRATIERVARDVYVYGDDLIVPTNAATAVFDHLQRYNCKVNDRKTFYRGSFRESCGVDAYRGHDVTPVYVTRHPPENRRDASELISWVSAGNHFYKKGYYQTSSFLFDKVERILGKLPYISENSGALGKKWWGKTDKSLLRTSRSTHALEIYAWVPSPVYVPDQLDGIPALFKSLQKLDRLVDLTLPRDKKPLERSVLHGAAALKRRWVPS
jgi:AcrR family transcriptional regulator